MTNDPASGHRHTTGGDDAVDLVAGVEVLAQQPETDLGHRDGVGCVHPEVG